MQKALISLLIILFSNSATAQTSAPEEIQPYTYDTTLKGGYKISLKMDDSLQYLFLKKGNTIITELASTLKGIPYKSLGYLGADFKDYFVLVHSFGSGNPHNIELIKKATGQNVLKGNAFWIDADEVRQALVYCENDVPSQRDRMVVMNVSTGRKEYLHFPDGVFNEPGVLNRISLKKIVHGSVTI